jgi:hypothetical protein
MVELDFGMLLGHLILDLPKLEGFPWFTVFIRHPSEFIKRLYWAPSDTLCLVHVELLCYPVLLLSRAVRHREKVLDFLGDHVGETLLHRLLGALFTWLVEEIGCESWPGARPWPFINIPVFSLLPYLLRSLHLHLFSLINLHQPLSFRFHLI